MIGLAKVHEEGGGYMAKYYNPGKVDVEKAAEGILDAGGGISSRNYGDHIHHTAYSKDSNQHLSWDESHDGKISNVHTDKDGHSYYQYGNGKDDSTKK